MKFRTFIRQKYYLLIFLFLTLAGCGDHKKGESNRQNRAEAGSRLFTNYGCAVCHSMRGEVLHGPALNEVWQKSIKVNRDGEIVELQVDRSYLKRSISVPDYEKVVGFESKAMPKTFLTEEDTESLIDYIISMNKAGSNN